MQWSAIREALRIAVASSTGITLGDGITTGSVFWGNSSREGGWLGPVVANLTIKSWVSVGVDEKRETFSGGVRTVKLCGNRRMTVTVRIESTSQKNGAEAVGHYSSLLRTRLRRDSVLLALRNAGLAVSWIAPTVLADYETEDRMLSVGITDLIILASEVDVDAGADGSGWIDSATLSSEHLTNVDGTNADVVIKIGTTP